MDRFWGVFFFDKKLNISSHSSYISSKMPSKLAMCSTSCCKLRIDKLNTSQILSFKTDRHSCYSIPKLIIWLHVLMYTFTISSIKSTPIPWWFIACGKRFLRSKSLYCIISLHKSEAHDANVTIETIATTNFDQWIL